LWATDQPSFTDSTVTGLTTSTHSLLFMPSALEVMMELYSSKKVPSRNRTPSESPFEVAKVPWFSSTFEVMQVMLETRPLVKGSRPLSSPLLSASMQRLEPEV